MIVTAIISLYIVNRLVTISAKSVYCKVGTICKYLLQETVFQELIII